MKRSNLSSEGWLIFSNWDSLDTSLYSLCEAWSHKKKKHKKNTAYRKSV